MSTPMERKESPSGWQPPAATLDEARWRAWAARGRAEELQLSATALRVAKWAAVAGLVAAVGIWSHLASFEVVVRFLVTAGAMGVMFQSFRARHYAVAVLYGALALLYNPVAPVFGFSGGWQRAVVAASVVPFVASLARRNIRSAS
jgi:hypothetical protein